MSPEAELQPGTVLAGKYRIERVLGEGGMGVVVAARHLHLDQVVAIKLIVREAARQPEAVSRLLREARAAAQLRSEHAVRVFDVGTTAAGTPFIVMEYLEGSDLAQVAADRGPIPLPLAVDWVLQACDALAEAHEAGIIHRDIKPGNLFLAATAHGRTMVKVVDFGLAKMAGPRDGSLTRSSVVMGSPTYMSPEQLRSTKDVDARTDIWSLGVILWQLVTGEVPFAAETFSEAVVRITVDPLPSLPKVRGVPRSLERVLGRALEKDPARRYQTVGELARALAPFANPTARDLALRIGARPAARASSSAEIAAGERGPAPDGGAGRGWRRVLIAAGIGLGALAIGVIVAIEQQGPAEPDASTIDASPAADAPSELAADAAVVADAAAAPDADAGLQPPPDAGAVDAATLEPSTHEPPSGTEVKKTGKKKRAVPFDPFASPD